MRFSVITVCWNSLAELEGTVRSAFEQTHGDLEFLVIDGASTDGTLDFLRAAEPTDPRHVFAFFSQKDRGLYDAMNRGLRLATGDFVVFMNAGDRFFEKTTLEKVAQKALETGADALFGETILVEKDRRAVGTMSDLSTRKLPKKLTAESLRRGMTVVHQSFYVRKSVAPFYDLRWRLCADIDWMIRCLQNSKKTARVDGILTAYLMDGMSKKRHRESLRERFEILKMHFGLASTLFNHGMIVFRAVAHRVSRLGKRKY